jgi:predicted dehydrogenase
MNLGLLGIDPSTATVAAAALRGGVRIPVACDMPAGAAPLEPSPRSVSWEHLLDPATCDAVLVASSDWSDDRAEVVRKLVQAGRPLILSQPLDLSMLYAYELDMIRRDSGAVLVPILPDRLHPFMARLRNWIEIRLPAASAPAREVQSEPWFHEQVNALHARIEQVEAAAKRPNGARR